ncbi:hypothetical protein Egran_05909 [Elaphomyces granulatus]|uniref:Calcipressin n=1 Tax=Elaphomyces granulatus TaxID=519963 RepID=A0A232LQC5_9EURO|nr:hypothetical protein Egran_05909 [Elaphomyces granulatus]
MAESISSAPGSVPVSRTSSSNSSSRSSSRPSLKLDLSNLPPLSQPSPPSNTLLITELHNLRLFQPSSLASIRSQITATAPLNSFSPLPSLRRIVCSLQSTDDAIRVRQQLEERGLLDQTVRVRIYFGEHTPIETTEEARRKKLLEAPHSQKLFFISPPPSPPHGWAMKTEDPPNKTVYASDLAEALAQLRTEQWKGPEADLPSPVSMSSDLPPPLMATSSWPASASGQRSRSSTLLYHPSDHGGSPNLPAVMVEDTSLVRDDSDTEMMSPLDGAPRRIIAQTVRPPVELME